MDIFEADGAAVDPAILRGSNHVGRERADIPAAVATRVVRETEKHPVPFKIPACHRNAATDWRRQRRERAHEKVEIARSPITSKDCGIPVDLQKDINSRLLRPDGGLAISHVEIPLGRPHPGQASERGFDGFLVATGQKLERRGPAGGFRRGRKGPIDDCVMHSGRAIDDRRPRVGWKGAGLRRQRRREHGERQ